MSKMVTARVPDALFEQGSLQLKELGFTPSDLVKAAFEYVLSEHSLPTKPKAQSSVRKLSDEQLAALQSSLAACSLNLKIPSDIAWDKQIAQEARVSRYEALA